MSIDFEIKRESLYEVVAKKLEDMILSDSFEGQKKLPSEHALAAGFDVSLPVIRQALVLLRERGIVVSKNGDGSYISEPAPEKLTEAIDRFSRVGTISPLDVFTVRTSLERTAVRLAAENITADEIEALRELNAEMKNAKGHRRAELDALFHTRIAEASGNMLLAMFISSLGTQLVPMFEKAALVSGANERGCEDHDEMIAILEAHAPDRAAECMCEHLMCSMRNFEVGKDL